MARAQSSVKERNYREKSDNQKTGNGTEWEDQPDERPQEQGKGGMKK